MKILLIEDDCILRQSLKELLEIKDYTVVDVVTKKEALCHFNEGINLVIIDINLPDGNGIDLCKDIRSVSNVPILFLTANDNEDTLVQGLESGGDDYMTKPFRINELYARISSLFRRSQISLDTMEIGDLKVFFKRYEIIKNNHRIQLSAVDYEILFMLLRHKNQVITRNQLLETIEKNGQYYVEDNTLSVHIKRIREKLGMYNNHSYIETIRGIGYRINQEVIDGDK